MRVTVYFRNGRIRDFDKVATFDIEDGILTVKYEPGLEIGECAYINSSSMDLSYVEAWKVAPA